MISNLLYSVCIRKEEGMCGMVVSQTRNTGTPDSFNLQSGDKQNGGTISDTAKSDTEIDTRHKFNCAQEFIAIASSKIASSHFCGTFLAAKNADTKAGAIPSDVLPLRVIVVTNNADPRLADTGFDLKYAQTPCSP